MLGNCGKNADFWGLTVEPRWPRVCVVDSLLAGQSIAETIVTLAKSMGLRCTVEGIETATQLEPFRAWGCDQVQGYLFSQPLSADDFTQLLRIPPQYDICFPPAEVPLTAE